MGCPVRSETLSTVESARRARSLHAFSSTGNVGGSRWTTGQDCTGQRATHLPYKYSLGLLDLRYRKQERALGMSKWEQVQASAPPWTSLPNACCHASEAMQAPPGRHSLLRAPWPFCHCLFLHARPSVVHHITCTAAHSTRYHPSLPHESRSSGQSLDDLQLLLE